MQSASLPGAGACGPRSCGRPPSPCGGECAPRRARSTSRGAWPPGSAPPRANGRRRRGPRLDQSRGVGGLQATLVLTLEFGSRMKIEISAAQPAITSSVVSAAARLVWPIRSHDLQTAQQGGAEARFMRAPSGVGWCCNRNGRTRRRRASQRSPIRPNRACRLSTRPVNTWSATSSCPRCRPRDSRKPAGKWKAASAGTLAPRRRASARSAIGSRRLRTDRSSSAPS